MTTQERNAAILRALEQRAKRATSSRPAARAALVANGVMTKDGKLKTPYRHLLDEIAPA